MDYYFNAMPLFAVVNIIRENFSMATKQLSAHISVAFRQSKSSKSIGKHIWMTTETGVDDI